MCYISILIKEPFCPPRGGIVSDTVEVFLSRNNRDRKPSTPSALDEARNELFSHIHRCGVLRASEEQQVEWMNDTVEFLHERYPAMTEAELTELKAIGLRFCQPVIVNRIEAEAETVAEAESETDDAEAETAAA